MKNSNTTQTHTHKKRISEFWKPQVKKNITFISKSSAKSWIIHLIYFCFSNTFIEKEKLFMKAEKMPLNSKEK